MIQEIIIRVLFLIVITGIGWLVGFIFKIKSSDIATLLIYVISPFVIFISILKSPVDWSYFYYALGALLTASIAAFCAYVFASFLWKDGRKNLFSFTGGTGNTGYFALPIILALFNDRQIAIAIFIILGVNIYEFTVGYFITAKGVLSTRHSLQRIIRLPIIYAALLGILFKMTQIDLGTIVLSSLDNFKGAYSVLGMMVIGITLASYRQIKVDWRFLITVISWKHLIYPIVGVSIFQKMIGLDAETLMVVTLMLATPMAGNTVVIASNLGVHPEKAALSVMISTILAVITVPLAVMWVNGLAG